MTNYINYALMIIGIFTVFTALIFIYLDKIKGEDMYFNLDIKEQEVKKVIEDAEEIITELNYTSEYIVKEMEETITKLRGYSASLVTPAVQPPPTIDQAPTKHIETLNNVHKPDVEQSNLGKEAAGKKQKRKEEVKETKFTSKQNKVLECASLGMSVTDIAKKLNMGHGEVSLIISLKEKENNV